MNFRPPVLTSILGDTPPTRVPTSAPQLRPAKFGSEGRRFALDQSGGVRRAAKQSRNLREPAVLEVYDFDPALYLNDEAAIEAYLDEARKAGNPQAIAAAEAVAKAARERLALVQPTE